MTGLWVVVTALATAVSFAGVKLVTSSVIRPVVPIVDQDNTTSPTTAPSSTTSTTVVDGGASPVRTTVPPTATTAPPVTRPPSQSATFATQGGVVTVRCVGNDIRLVSATPRDGWRLDVRDTGPARVRVRFIGPERYVELLATCQDGVPTRFSRNGELPEDRPTETTRPPRPPDDGDGRR